MGCEMSDSSKQYQYLSEGSSNLNPIDTESGLELINAYIDYSGTSEEDRVRLNAIKDIYSRYNFCLGISINFTKNSDGSASYRFGFYNGVVLLMDYYHGNGGVVAEIENRLVYLWLNGKIERNYVADECEQDILELSSKLNATTNADEWLKIADNEKYSYIKEVCFLTNVKNSVPDDSRSSDNLFIADVLLKNYYSYNIKLSDKVNSFNESYLIKPYLATIYKEYGDRVFGYTDNGVYIIDNYDDIFGELDKVIMKELNLKSEDFR